MISEKYKFIFIHVPKTAGNSIQNYLLKYSSDLIRLRLPCHDGIERFDIQNQRDCHLWKHSSLNEYANVYGGDIKDYFIFAVTRNPFDKVVSHYFSPNFGRENFNRVEFEDFISTVKPLEEYTGINSKIFSSHSLPTPSISYLRFEFLEKDFLSTLRRIGLPETYLIKRNVGPRRNHYRSYFDEATKKLIEKKHAFEMKIGRYKF